MNATADTPSPEPDPLQIRKGALVSGVGFAIFLSSLLYSTVSLNSVTSDLQKSENALAKTQEAIAASEKRLRNVQAEVVGAQTHVEALRNDVARLESDQATVVASLGEVLTERDVKVLDPDVRFADIQSDFNDLSPGVRKRAMLIALLMTWKSIKFKPGGTSLVDGLGSVEFLLFVLDRVGITIPPPAAGQLRSESLMAALTKVEMPQVGDIAMYKGSSGYYGVFVISLGAQSGAPIGLGGYNETLPLQIRSLEKGNRATRPFLGYYRANYGAAASSP